jgi:fructose-1,6-bisphosphatase/inositol monophosphatase family enzyme
VTIADKEVNQLIVDRVQAEYPDHGVLGEEISYKSERERLWVCDPIDGTPAFIYHIPTSMFSLALVVDGLPQVGVAFNPWTGELYSAVIGKGAFRDDKSIKVSQKPWGKGTRLAGSSDGSVDHVIPRTGLKEIGVEVISGYSVVFKGCLVADGSADGRIWAGTGAHDVAAVKLIVEEAGGMVTDHDGNEQRYDRPINGIIMSNGIIHDELLKLVKASK